MKTNYLFSNKLIRLGISITLCLCIILSQVEIINADSRPCLANHFSVTISIIPYDETEEIQTRTFSKIDGVSQPSVQSCDFIIQADKEYFLEIAYDGTSAGKNFTAMVRDIAAPGYYEADHSGQIFAKTADCSTYSSGVYANKSSREYTISSYGYGNYQFNVSLNGINETVTTNTSDRNFVINTIFQGRGATENSFSGDASPGSTLTVNTRYSADRYIYQWRKSGSSNVLSTEQSYTPASSEGEEYICTVQRKDESTTSGCTGSDSWTYTYTIKNQACWLTKPSAINPVYSGSAVPLINPGTSNDGTVEYSKGRNPITGEYAWKTDIPTATSTGDYTIYCRVNSSKVGLLESEIVVISVIARGYATINKEPEEISGLIYDGENHELVTAGTASTGRVGAKVHYALGTDAVTPPSSGWSETIPTGKMQGHIMFGIKRKETMTKNVILIQQPV